LTADLSVILAPLVQAEDRKRKGLVLSNPVMTASGTFGYGDEYGGLFDIQQLGAIVCKGVFLNPREGNHQPRLVETASGVINSIGLQGIGIKALIEEKAPVWAGWKVPVIVNIAGDTVEEYWKVARELEGVAGVSGIEVNISCPNVKNSGAAFGLNAETAAQVTRAVRTATTLPVIVKLTPIAADICNIAREVEKAGADAVCVANTFRGMAIDVNKRKPVLANITGGLSGPAIKPLALALVYEVAGAVSIPVIGCGGITTANDALEFMMAGAAAVEIGSASFANPRASLDILEGIQKFMEKERISSLKEIIGAARKKPNNQ
jgi:dihydroorotate dehydrogenase (NAD+) catalytic subunit